MFSSLIDIIFALPTLGFGLLFLFIAGTIGAWGFQLIFGGNFWVWFAVMVIIGLFYKPPALRKGREEEGRG
ncbi:hypothetical protein [Desulforamulus ruminis]|uniref:Uncharacterized protein n=1 Tax=Desulforamulus ruminis (strain ATCC 23193 / DSM 2154 / NCIMB 8452 / DL) TaxID=696281 RepID=F6DTF3_DESRL|nr:hypothetical protein [Desulforamulus ruminis]AEG60015.1 hypothetical protein Desru_1751 [Desulforamulus ruminis DSM 2154]